MYIPNWTFLMIRYIHFLFFNALSLEDIAKAMCYHVMQDINHE